MIDIDPDTRRRRRPATTKQRRALALGQLGGVAAILRSLRRSGAMTPEEQATLQGAEMAIGRVLGGLHVEFRREDG